MKDGILTIPELLKLKRWNTPTIYNGWEAVTKHDRTKGFFNLEETRDFMPQMGPMIGYVVTVVIEPSNPVHTKDKDSKVENYRKYVASLPMPKICVVSDLDDPHVGSFWGEVNANTHRALGCVGTITHGAVRDVDEMANAGFKAVAKRMCVGHAYSVPVKWDCEVEVFGCKIRPGDLIHADKHGFLVIPREDMAALLDAVLFMDNNECDHVIPAGRFTSGSGYDEIISRMSAEGEAFGKASAEHFNREK